MSGCDPTDTSVPSVAVAYSPRSWLACAAADLPVLFPVCTDAASAIVELVLGSQEGKGDERKSNLELFETFNNLLQVITRAINQPLIILACLLLCL